LTGGLQQKFSHSFDGAIWNTLALPEKNILLLEIRNVDRKQVSFSALDLEHNIFLWRGVELEENWWVEMSAASQEVILFSIYIDTANPDTKGILAYSLQGPKPLWAQADFSITGVDRTGVHGVASRPQAKPLVLDLHTGQSLPGTDFEGSTDTRIQRPFQYVEGTAYFNTVRTFLNNKLNLSVVTALEYVESGDRIFISYYVQEKSLVNYLIVLSAAGEILLQEKLDEQLKGIGQDTFFILAGCLIFVRNKRELRSYFL
jgi:hypothetical protein